MSTRKVSSRPSTTVVLPVFNGADRIGRAIASIQRQTEPVDHMIVVDDGSTDDLDAALQSVGFSGELVRQPNRGQGAAWNAGISRVSTSHVLFLDHDDEWPTDRVEWQSEVIDATGEDIVIGAVLNTYESTNRQVNMGSARVFGAAMFATDVFTRVGPLSEDRRIHEVFDWWSRASRVVTVTADKRIALIRHIHGGNMTVQSSSADRHDLVARIRDHVRRSTKEGMG